MLKRTTVTLIKGSFENVPTIDIVLKGTRIHGLHFVSEKERDDSFDDIIELENSYSVREINKIVEAYDRNKRRNRARQKIISAERKKRGIK